MIYRNKNLNEIIKIIIYANYLKVLIVISIILK